MDEFNGLSWLGLNSNFTQNTLTNDPSFRFYNYGVTDATIPTVQAAITNNGGNGTLTKVLDYVFKYGGQAIDILSRSGVIPNKNLQAVLNGQINTANLAKLPTDASGKLIAPTQLTTEQLATIDRGASSALIDFRNPVTLVIIILLIYFFVKSLSPNKK